MCVFGRLQAVTQLSLPKTYQLTVNGPETMAERLIPGFEWYFRPYAYGDTVIFL